MLSQKIHFGSRRRAEPQLTALRFACKSNHVRAAAYLIKHGADVEIPNSVCLCMLCSRLQVECPLLHQAVIDGQTEMVLLLIQAGASVSASSKVCA